MSIHYGSELALATVRSDARSPLSFLRSVRPYLWVAVAMTFVFVVVGLFYIVQRKPRYVAEARLVVENIRLDASRQELLPTASFVDPLIVDSQVEILKSPSLARKAGESLGAEKAVELMGTSGQRTDWAALIKGFLPSFLAGAFQGPAEPPSPLASLGQTIETGLAVRRLGQSTVIAVTFMASDAESAAKVVNALVQLYLDDQAASAAVSSGAVSAWLRDRVKDFGLKARVVSWASPPTQRSGPRASVLLVAFACAGAVLGAMAALGLGALDTRLRDPQIAAAAIGGEFFGALPRFKRRRRLRRPPLDPLNQCREPPTLSLTAAVDHPRSQLAHLVRRIRAVILRRRPGSQIVGITSTMSGEGTTTIAANLAHAAAAGGQRVLLVDANLYKPDLSAALAPGASLGLVNILTGQATIHDAVYRTPAFMPDLLPCGTITGPSNVFERVAQTGALTRALSEHYDLIIFDLPPMHPATDPVFASLYVDAVVVVVEWGAVSEATAKKCLAASGLADKVVGFVFNEVSRRQFNVLSSSGLRGVRRRARALYVDDAEVRTS